MSSVVVVAAAAAVVGATTAFFSDTETSTGNVFTAGSIDLKVDSDCHYWNYVGDVEGADENGYVDVGCGKVGANGVGVGQWSENDLEDGVHKFFSFNDLKPGDKGEDTISLHVYDNDAWGRINFNMRDNDDNGLTEPESDVDSTDGADNGELLSAMGSSFRMWLDQGEVPGFQNDNPVEWVDAAGNPVEGFVDVTEGDNVWQDGEPEVYLDRRVDLRDVLQTAWSWGGCEVGSDGHNDYDVCNGLAQDGRLVGSTTYYLGFEWALPLDTTNEVQTDSLGGDLGFEVVQHRNNPNPWEL